MKNDKKIVKQKMIESAAKEFAAHGFEGANINTISIKAGFGKGTIYNYFKNKDSLLIEVMRYASHLSTQLMCEKMANEKNVIKKIYLVINSHFEFCIRYESLLRVLIQTGYSSPPEMQKQILEAMNECYSFIMKIIEEGKKQKIFSSDMDSFTSANLLSGMLFHHDCTCWAFYGKITDIKKETDCIFNLFINGISLKKIIKGA
ncbi:TetR/AcrR family transcriptional regulator [Candidatus Poribacteria bacterium]|nr:TetR/AcrR family transcriptional regulator [Candidatus Poribacteria bacterium]